MATQQALSLLPASLPPIGLDRVQAAAYIGVSPATFDRLVEAGRMPKPRDLGVNRKIWDVSELVEAFRALPHYGESYEQEAKDGHDNQEAWDELA